MTGNFKFRGLYALAALATIGWVGLTLGAAFT